MVKPAFDNWTTQLRKGILELCVLTVLRESRSHGYEIVQRLRTIEGLGVGEGTIYPILSRFRKEGLVETFLEESPAGPARKCYRLTPRGRGRLSRMNQHWTLIRRGVDRLSPGAENEPA